jgi:hypothetical protein
MPVQNTSEKFTVYFGESGLTLTTTLSKAGGSFSSVAPTITDASNGYYIITPLAAHRDTLGVNSWLFVSGDESRPYVERVESTDNAAILSAIGNAPSAEEISEPILAALTGSSVVQVASPNVRGNLVLTQGDTYDGIANPKAAWNVTTNYTDGWTVNLTIRDKDDVVVYTTTGSVDSTTVVTVPIDAPTGLVFSGCPGVWQGKFDVQLSKGLSVATIAIGTCFINEDQTR